MKCRECEHYVCENCLCLIDPDRGEVQEDQEACESFDRKYEKGTE